MNPSRSSEMLPSTMDKRCLSMRVYSRSGSLPLKKRKVSLDNSSSSVMGQVVETCNYNRTQSLHEEFSSLDSGFCNSLKANTHMGMTALSLVATAAASSFLSPDSLQTSSFDVRYRCSSPCDADKISDNISQISTREDDELSADESSFSPDMYRQKGSKQSTNTTMITSCSNARNKSKCLVQTASNSHQDRRYTGGAGEVRCFATTTRGRPCAYTCVNETKYCYLHADYDTNPPPRRWSHRGKISSTINTTSSEDCAPLPKVSDESVSSRFSKAQVVPNSYPPSLSSDEMSRLPSPFGGATDEIHQPVKRTRRSSTTKLAAKHADSPFPLLSMISTDQWYEKIVKIASGPLKGRTGKVEKWGNGWVSVNIAGEGLHNRRSFELYLLTTDDECDTEFESHDGGARFDDENNLSLLRCVSRDVVSPPIYPASSDDTPDYNGWMPNATDTREAPKMFSSGPPSTVSQKPRPMFAVRDSASRLSPVLFHGSTQIMEPPQVTPLPRRDAQHYDERAFTEEMHLPVSRTKNGMIRVAKKK